MRKKKKYKYRAKNAPDVPHKYEKGSFLYDLKMCIIHKWIKRRRLYVDITMRHLTPSILVDGVKSQNVLIRREHWTDRPSWELSQIGYRRCIGLHDSLAWWTVPVYIRIHGGHKYDMRETDENGRLLWSQDTSATLNDAMLSTSTADFVRGMGKPSLPAMDIQKIIFMGIVGVGAVLGIKMLGIF